jgi:Bucentaur or craniofacial development
LWWQVNVLDKSKMDWKEFKKSDTAIEDELESYKKSNNQYLDKKEFLQRSELREYEQERDKRLASDIRTRGRL